MALESATWITDLVSTNPVGASDDVSSGDDHIRMLKTVIKTCFPNAGKALYFPTTETKSGNFGASASDQNKTFIVTTSGGAVTATMPSLSSGDAGWECFIVKITTDTNPVFVSPPSGTIQSGEYSGLTKTRRGIPGRRTRVLWTGTAWLAERVVDLPIGTVLPNWLSSVPVGFENANGATLSSSANYPDYNSAKGSLVLPDCTGRVIAGKESVASRLTAGISGVDGATLGSAGGSQSFSLATANLPSHNHTFSGGVTSNDGAHTHTIDIIDPTLQQSISTGGANAANDNPIVGVTSSNGAHTHTVTGTIGNTGSGTAKGAVPPTIVLNNIVVVE